MMNSNSNKIIVAKFNLSTSRHIDYEKLLVENNIEFEIQTLTEYLDSGYGTDLICFLVSINDIDKAKALKNKVKITQYKYKANPKFMKIFWIGIIALIIYVIALLLFL